MSRLPVVALLSVAAFGLVAPDVLAQAGGGSSGFGGGGGGGGGGGSYGGGGSSGSDGGSVLSLLIFVAIFAGVILFTLARAKVVRRRRRAARVARDERVSTASAEAAEEDPVFAAPAVKAAAGTLYRELQDAWSRRDVGALEPRLGPDLLVEWRRRIDDFESKGWTNMVRIHEGPQIAYVGIVNREGAGEDRVTVSISATLHSVVVTSAGDTIYRDEDTDKDGLIDICEYWTLARSGDGWRLVSIEQEEEGAHHLDAPIVTAPWSDDARLADETVVELATADAPPADVDVSELVSVEFEGTAREKALDLALADPRCAPDVLEVAARRAVAAWAEAVDGDDAALLAVATPEAARALLYPDGGEQARVVVRGPALQRLAITALHTDAGPPRMDVEARVRGRRYIEDRDTAAVLAGDKDRAQDFTERWTFALEGSADTPWRLVA